MFLHSLDADLFFFWFNFFWGACTFSVGSCLFTRYLPAFHYMHYIIPCKHMYILRPYSVVTWTCFCFSYAVYVSINDNVYTLLYTNACWVVYFCHACILSISSLRNRKWNGGLYASLMLFLTLSHISHINTCTGFQW